MLIDYIKRAFYKPNWKLAFRESNENDSLNTIVKNNKKFYSYTVEGNYWCADPFVICDGDLIYVFCECFINEKQKGTIAVAEYKEGKISNMRTVIEQDYHMSYPCVFKYGSDYYMIPETADNRTIELYHAKQFPYEWELTNTLKKNVRCVDSTVFFKDDGIYVIGYILGNKNKICIYQLDMVNKTITLTYELEDDDTGRPAGNILVLDNEIFRLAQISKKKYGESISIKKIVSFNSEKYNEIEFSQISGKDIFVDGEKIIDRIHTFNMVGNIEIIDYSCDSFELFRPIKIIMARCKQKLYDYKFQKISGGI